MYEVLTSAELALGRTDAAEEWAERAVASASDETLVEAGAAQRARASVMLAKGEVEAAAARAVAAAEAALGAGAPLESGRSRVVAGQALAQAGRVEEAGAELEKAVSTLTRSGAQGYRARAVAELHRLRRSHRRARQSPGQRSAALTERERDIAELVCAGKTNRQIAAERHLSEKTVERHLTHMFEKLGVSTRAAVAAVISAERASAR